MIGAEGSFDLVAVRLNFGDADFEVLALLSRMWHVRAPSHIDHAMTPFASANTRPEICSVGLEADLTLQSKYHWIWN